MPSVLWIDDDSVGFGEIEAGLQARGTSLVLALNAWTGLERLRTELFDLVIVDGIVQLGAPPGETGFQAHFLREGPPNGLQLVQMVRQMEGLHQPRHGFIICSGLDWPELCKAYPELTADLPFIGKGVLYHQRQLFMDLVVQALDVPAEPRLSPQMSSPETLEETFEGRWHDLRINVLTSLGTLDSAAGRLISLCGGEHLSGIERVLPTAKRFAELAGEAVSDFAYRARNRRNVERLEDRVNRLDAAVRDGSAANVSMAARLAADVLKAMPDEARTGRAAELEALHKDLQVLSALSEIRITSELLASAARDTGALDAPEADLPLDTSELLRQIASLFHADALQRRIELQTDKIEPRVMLSHGLPSHYRRMLTNVVENAVKYNGQLRDTKAWVKLIHGMRGSEIVTIVESWGRPIPKAQLEGIFEPRVRGDNAGLSGLGLGLANARRMAEGLGGTVEIQTGRVGRDGHATTSVIFAIPADRPASA